MDSYIWPNITISSVREVSNLVSSGKIEESGFWKPEVERVAEFVRAGWFLGWERIPEIRGN